MFSMPPATTTSASPQRMAWAASITALRDDPQTLLMVMASTSQGRPALTAACLPGFWPYPQGRTIPMMHSSTSLSSILARLMASLMTIAPRSVAPILLNPPPKLPRGVRVALTITALFIGIFSSIINPRNFSNKPGIITYFFYICHPLHTRPG